MTRFLLCLLLGLTPACSSFDVALEEFDALAQWSDPQTEPATAVYPARAELYDWWNWFLWSDPVDTAVENPSAYIRELVEELGSGVGSDLTSLAQVSRRLLWVAQRDPNAFNRIQALQGVERVMQILAIDPLDPTSYATEPDAAERRAEETALGAAQTTLRRLFSRPAERGGLTAAERREYVRALEACTARPLSRLRSQRDLIRIAWSTYVRETDPVVVRAAATALREAIRFATCNGLRAGVVPEEYSPRDRPIVRAEVFRIYRRLGGVRAVPFLVDLAARPPAGPLEQRYDRDPNVRMLLVRYCAQLKAEFALARSPQGSAPVEFLYYVGTDDTEERFLRRVALEGLARCLAAPLGLERIPEGDEWARAWWKKYIATRGD